MTIVREMRPGRETRVVLGDYAGASRTALALLIADLPEAELVASVDDAEQIVMIARELQPDVVIVDDRLLRGGGWTAEDLDARLIVVGVDDDPGYRARARRIGAEAWVPKERADSLLPLMLTRPAPVSSLN